VRPSAFDYHAPRDLEEACRHKAEHGPDAAVLAGGQSLIPLMASRLRTPRVLIDIKRIPELGEARRENGTLVAGATVRQARLHEDPAIAAAVAALPEAARHIGHLETRHRGTLGGSLAHADPSAELPTVAVGLGAELVVRSVRGERRIAAADFFTGPRATALEPDELLVAVRFPADAAGATAFAEIARRHGDPAMAAALARVELAADGTVAAVTLALGAIAGRPQRAGAVEAALQGAAPTAERIAEATRGAAELAEADPEPGEVGPTPSPPGIPIGYRRRLAAAVAGEALTRAVTRAKGEEAQ
jgi:aerobic carbon-monoxide dehydrogenase medium subunit